MDNDQAAACTACEPHQVLDGRLLLAEVHQPPQQALNLGHPVAQNGHGGVLGLLPVGGGALGAAGGGGPPEDAVSPHRRAAGGAGALARLAKQLQAALFAEVVRAVKKLHADMASQSRNAVQKCKHLCTDIFCPSSLYDCTQHGE